LSDLRVYRGDDGVFDTSVYQADGRTPQDLTGFTFTATVKERLDDVDPGLWQGAIGSGITVVDAVAGTLRIAIPRATTAAWAPGVLLWDLQALTADARKRTIDHGRLTVIADVTRA
jgi:hypothetical protein